MGSSWLPDLAYWGCLDEAHKPSEDGKQDANETIVATRAELAMLVLLSRGLPCSGTCSGSCSALVAKGRQVLCVGDSSGLK